MSEIHSHIRALNEKRLNLHAQLNSLYDRPRGRSMGPDERAIENSINAEITSTEHDIRRYVDRDVSETESAKLRMMNPAIFGGSAAGVASRLDENRHLRAVLTGSIDPSTGQRYSCELDLATAAREREMLRAGADGADIRNALYSDTGNAGSLVPRSMANALYGYLESASGMMRAPTTKLSTAGGENMDFPRFAAHSLATQVISQGTALAGTDPTFAKMTLGAYKYGQLLQISSEAIQDTSIDIVSLAMRDMGRGLGRLLDVDLVAGSGSGEPTGLITATGLAGGAGTVATGGSLVNATYENLVDLVHSIADEYRHSGSCGWLMKDSTIAQVRKLRDGAGGTVGAPLWEPSLTAGLQNGQPDRLLGFPVFGDPNVASQGSAAKSIAFLDFSAYYVRTAGPVRLERSDDFAFSTDLVSLRAVTRVDGGLVDDKASSVISNRVA